MTIRIKTSRRFYALRMRSISSTQYIEVVNAVSQKVFRVILIISIQAGVIVNDLLPERVKREFAMLQRVFSAGEMFQRCVVTIACLFLFLWLKITLLALDVSLLFHSSARTVQCQRQCAQVLLRIAT